MLAIVVAILASCSPSQEQTEDSGSGMPPGAARFRVAPFNIEDLRGDDLADPGIPPDSGATAAFSLKTMTALLKVLIL